MSCQSSFWPGLPTGDGVILGLQRGRNRDLTVHLSMCEDGECAKVFGQCA